VKITNSLIIITAIFLSFAAACQNNSAGTNSANANQPAANSPANTNQTSANKTEANKTETPKTENDKLLSSSGSSLATPSDAYKAAYNARQQKDLEGLKKVMSKDALEFFTMMGDGKSPDDGLKQLIGNPQAATAETRNEKINGDKATLEYLNEKGGWGPMDFVKEGADWKLTIPKPDTKMTEDKTKK
jgi:hypothetical protein